MGNAIVELLLVGRKLCLVFGAITDNNTVPEIGRTSAQPSGQRGLDGLDDFLHVLLGRPNKMTVLLEPKPN
jgi:hypothetical protein